MASQVLPSLEGIEVMVDYPIDPTSEELIERLHQELREHAPRRIKEEHEPLEWGDEIDLTLAIESQEGFLPGAACRYFSLELRSILNLPGLVEQVVGTRQGQRQTFSLHLPKDYPVPPLAGQEVKAHLLVTSASAVVMPDLEDAEMLAKAELGDDIDSALESVAELWEEEAGQQLVAETIHCMLDVFSERVFFEVEETVLDNELTARWKQTDGQVLQELGFSEDVQEQALERYLETLDVRENVEAQLRTLAGLKALTEAHDIKPSKHRSDMLLDLAAQRLGLTLSQAKAALTAEPEQLERATGVAYQLAAIEYLLSVTKVEILGGTESA